MQQYGITIAIGGDIGDLSRALRNAEGQIKSFSQRNEALFSKLDKLALPVAAAFAGVAASIGATLKTFAEFESTLNSIKAVSGATTAEINAMKAAALDLGATTKFSAQEAAQGMAELSKAGFTTRETLAAIPGVLSLAAAGGTSVAVAAEIAGGALRGFGLAAADAAKVSDILAQVANKSSVDVTDVGESFKYVAPLANATKQNIEGMSAAIAIMGNQMIKGSQAGTTIRSSLASLLNPSKDAQTSMAQLGLSIKDTEGKMLPLQSIVDQLRTKTAKMTDVQKSATIANIFGTEALSGMLALINTSPAEYDKMVKSMHSANGAAKEMADTMNQGLKPSFDAMLGSLETLGIQLGENFAPALTSLVNGFATFVNTVIGLPASMKLAIAGFGAAAVVALGLVTALTAVGGIVTIVGAGVGALGLTATGVAPLIAGLAIAAGLATAGFATLSDEAGTTTGQLKDQITEVNSLTAEYDSLSKKTNLTTKEKERLRAILERLQAIAPAVVGGYNVQGKATYYMRDAVLSLNETYREQIRLSQIAAQAAREGQRAGVAAATIKMQDTNNRIKELDRNRKAILARKANEMVPGANAGRPDWRAQASARELDRALAANEAERATLAPRSNAEAAERDKLNSQYRQKYFNANMQVPVGFVPETPTLSAPVSMPNANGGRKAKTGGSKAKDKAGDEAYKNKITQLENALALALKKNDDNQGGISGERKIKNDFAATFSKTVRKDDESGLQKVRVLKEDIFKLDKQMNAEGEKTVRSIKDYLAVIQQIPAMKDEADRIALKANADDAKKTLETRNTAERDAQIERVDGLEKERLLIQARYDDEIAMIEKTRDAEIKRINEKLIPKSQKAVEIEQVNQTADANVSAAFEKNKRAVSSFNQTWKNSLAGMAQELQQFANNPDLGSIAAFTFDIVTNKEKVKEWTDAIGQASNALSGAGEAGVELAAGLNPVTLGITAAVAAFGYVSSKLQENAKEYTTVKDAVTDYIATLKLLDLQLRTGIVTSDVDAINTKVNAIDALIAKVGEFADKRYEQNFGFDIPLKDENGQNVNDANGRPVMTRAYDPVDMTPEEFAKKGGRGANWTYSGAVEYKQATEDLRKLAEKRQELIRELIKNDATTSINNFGSAGVNIQKKKDLGFYTSYDANTGTMKTDEDQIVKERFAAAESTMTGLLDARTKAIQDGNADLIAYVEGQIASFAPQFQLLKGEADAIEATTGAMSSAQTVQEKRNQSIEEYIDLLKRQIEIEDEINTSGRDLQGNKISLNDELQIKTGEMRVEHEKRVADILQRQEDIKKRIQKIDDDERKKIADIENEGIAERAKTETQSKQERIAEVKKNAEEQRIDANKELKNLKDQAVQEETNYTNQSKYLKNITKEKIDALDREKEAINKVLREKEKDLNISRNQTAEMIKQAIIANRPVDMKKIKSTVGEISKIMAPALSVATTVDPKTVKEGTIAPNSNGGEVIRYQSSWNAISEDRTQMRRDDGKWIPIPKFHTGGIVPGSPGEEVFALLQAGERVQTVQQQRREADMKAGKSIVSSVQNITKNTTVEINVEQNITTQPGQSPSEFGNAATNDLNKKLVRFGLPTIG
jgi:TP901 family phage tail tape measure protein